jgi:hypothetical protein
MTAGLKVPVMPEKPGLRKVFIVAQAAALPKIFIVAVPTRMTGKSVTWRMDIASRLKAVRSVP